MKTVVLPGGERVPALGMGTWNMGDAPARREDELAALRAGLDAGIVLIDTAEMYGEGRSETLVAEAVTGRRDEVFLVSKVLPHHATREGTRAACEASLRRLRTDRLDLYLLHWASGVPIAESVEALEALRAAGKVRHWGVSNLDLIEMEELAAHQAGARCAVNQVLYNLSRRGIEWDLLPWMRERGMPVMAYSPLEQARLTRHAGLKEFAARHGMTPAQAALAWLLSKEDVIVIPKSGSAPRVRENAAALEIALDAAQLAELDRLFPPPRRAGPLEMI